MKRERVIEAEAAACGKEDPSAWARMSDVQRTQWFLRSTRLHDQEVHTCAYGSLNGPDPDMAFTNPSMSGNKTN